MFNFIKKSGIAGVLLVLLELLVFLLVLNFLTEIARGDDISDQIGDVDRYLKVIDEIQTSEVKKQQGSRTIVCDAMEINHVYRQIEADVVSHRLDQLLIRNRVYLPRHLDANGRVLEEAGYRHLIDGWCLLDNCRRYDNDADRTSWNKWLSGTLRGYPELMAVEFRCKTRYWGEFVSPVQKVGDYYTVRLTQGFDTVIVKSKQLSYSHSIIDLETEERREIGNERRLRLNDYKNGPTVIGEAAVRR